MNEINDFVGRLNETMVLWISGLIGAAFVFILIFDSIRRNRRRKRFGSRTRSSQPNIFKRASANLHALREELGRRGPHKGRRRDRDK